MKLKKWVRVRIPASSSNFGPGYDVLGLAFKLYNEIELSIEENSRNAGVFIEIQGEGAERLPKDERNIIWQTIKGILHEYHLPISSVRFHFRMKNAIPLSRGLGSSAAAYLGGILAANAMAGQIMNQDEILHWAVKMEKHPDNVVPQLVGGFCVCAVSERKTDRSRSIETKVQFIKLPMPKKISAVVCLPEFELSTKKARAVLPKKISHRDAVFNVSRASLLVGALAQGEVGYLKTAMEDKLHQNYRKKLVPGFDRVMQNAYRNGALGAALSGAGPSILAFAPNDKAYSVGKGMEKGFLSAGKTSRSLVLDIDYQGAKVETT